MLATSEHRFSTSSVSPAVLEIELFDEEQSGHSGCADICSFEIVARFIYLSLGTFYHIQGPVIVAVLQIK